MKKTTILLLSVISIIVLALALTFFFLNSITNYSNHERATKCMNTNEESLINDCLEYNGFFNKDNILESTQLTYDFYEKNYSYNFKDKKINNNFINFYETALIECKNIQGCKVNNNGKNYYIALNKCLLNDNCIDIFINSDKDCLLLFNEKFNKIPKNLQYLITIDKNHICKIKEKSL